MNTMTFNEILKAAWLEKNGDMDYPSAGTEDMAVLVRAGNRAVGLWEQEIWSGVLWSALKKSGVFTFSGTGTDLLLADFLAFVPDTDKVARISVGWKEYEIVPMSQGIEAARSGISRNIAWVEGASIRTIPSAVASETLPYVRKATRMATGMETTYPDMEDPDFMVDIIVAALAKSDSDFDEASDRLASAKDKLRSMKYPYYPTEATRRGGFSYGS